MLNVDVNYLAVIAAAIVWMLFSMLWHSTLLFGKQFAKKKGTKKGVKKDGKRMPVILAVDFIAVLVMAYFLAYFIELTTGSVIPALFVGLFIWLGFIATTTLMPVLWEGKPVKMYLLKNLHHIIGFLLMALIIGAWR